VPKPEDRVVDVANLLADELRGNPCFGSVGVGEHEGFVTIFVYTKYDDKAFIKAVDGGYRGFPVRVKNIGQITPAKTRQDQGVELGQPPAADARRDAVHVAIVPAVYKDLDGYDTLPSSKVKFAEDGSVYDTDAPDWEGIIDPFTPHMVSSGQKVWILMRPGAVKHLRHTWQHVSLEDESV